MTESTKKSAALVLSQSRKLIDAEDLLRTPVEDLDENAIVTAFSVLDILQKKVIKERSEALRTAIIRHAKDFGYKTQSSGGGEKYTSKVGNAVINVVRIKKNQGYDDVSVKLLLAEKGLSLNPFLSVKTEYVLNEEKIEKAINLGVFTEEEVKKMKKSSVEYDRLTVKKSNEVKALLLEMEK